MKTVTIGSSVKEVRFSAFSECNNIESVTCYATTVPTAESPSYTFWKVEIANATLYVPEAALQDYKSQAPWSGFGKIISIEVAEAEKFKTDNADILGKTIDNVSSSDLDAINKALEDYDKLSDAAKGKLTDGEKDLLDALKEKAEEIKAAEEADAAATAEAEKFKTDNADILGKTTDNISSSDLDAINKALEDYDKLSDAAKGKLTNEKELLDALKEKAEEITGISSIFINTNDEKCYNLNGQRVNKSAKGLIIKNGKKVVVK